MAEDLAQLAERFLPTYLLPGDRGRLLDAINSFPHERGYYTDLEQPTYLQGDGLTRFVVFNFFTAERKEVLGLVLSNSCDISPDNRPDPAQRIVFAPIIKLRRFAELLLRNGRAQAQVDSAMERLRRQHDNGAFYLPAHGSMEDSVVLLDDVHSEPLDHFWNANKHRVVRLSDFGFWLLTLKLSINFSRLHEEVTRGTA
jgi:hypothetical protein